MKNRLNLLLVLILIFQVLLIILKVGSVKTNYVVKDSVYKSHKIVCLDSLSQIRLEFLTDGDYRITNINERISIDGEDQDNHYEYQNTENVYFESYLNDVLGDDYTCEEVL